MKSLLLAALAFLTVSTSLADTTDPYLWLEVVAGERALNWVRARNAESESLLEAEPGFAAMRDGIRSVLDSRGQIPYVARRGDQFYNFWRDDRNPRGRR